jgi:type I restriction enzyme S subunit
MSNANADGQIDLPTGWVSASVEDVCQINPPLDRCILNDGVAVNFVPMRAVEPEGGGLIRPESRPYGEVKKGYTSFLSGDVIMAKITPCMENGKTTVVPELSGSVCFGSTEFHVMRPEDGMAARWVASFLLQHETRRAAQRAMAGGVGQMRVPAAFLEAVRVPVAPSAEQERIADALDELLSDLDAGEAALERVRDKLKRYRASVLKAAVEGMLTAEWRKQHPQVEPASELLKRILVERRRLWEEEQLRKFKEKGRQPPKNWTEKYKEPVAADTAKLPSLPAGWCWATLEQLSWSAGYGTSVKCREINKGLAVLRIPNIIGGRVNLNDLKFGPSDYIEPDEDLIRVGDLLVIRTNGSRNLIGRGAVVRDEQTTKLSFASYLIRLRLLPNAALLLWVSLLWDTFHVRRWIETRAATSAGQYNISLGVLETLILPVPPTVEQDAIVEAIEDQLSVIDHLEADFDSQMKSAHALRQAILRHAFTGKLVPQDPRDEPASELLKCIAIEREQRAREAAAAKRSNGRQPLHASMARIPGKAGRTVTKGTINGRIADR